jgi:hypothetical protein
VTVGTYVSEFEMLLLKERNKSRYYTISNLSAFAAVVKYLVSR